MARLKKDDPEYIRLMSFKQECIDCLRHADSGGNCGGRLNKHKGNPCIIALHKGGRE